MKYRSYHCSQTIQGRYHELPSAIVQPCLLVALSSSIFRYGAA
ncbi:hypothetical protein U9W90_003649 [Enterobacter hormaechei]